MKKTYISPAANVVVVTPKIPLTIASGVSSNDEYGLGYGGVDTGGDKEPSSRWRDRLWDDD